MIMQKVKKRLPYPLKQGLKYIYGAIPLSIRYGKVFRQTYAFLQESQWRSREQLEEYQMQQLEKLLHHAYTNVPYYRRIFDERGLKPKDIQSAGDLRKLPYLTKEIIREYLPELIARNYPKFKLHYVTTGGSTGIPMGLYWEKGITDPKERAFVWRQWNWAGHKFGKKRVILRGNVINRVKNGKRQWWEYNPLDNALILSSYDMTEENLPKYVEKINEFKPTAIQGYSSSLYILANFLRNNNLKIKNIKCILTSSETLYPHQRKLIEEYLGAKIYDHYGNTERNALVMQCEKDSYHIIPEYGIVELIDKGGNPVCQEDKRGEIVATGFNNYAMPFIRYKTMDLGVYANQKCSCGRNYSLLKKIEGRLQELVVAKDKGLIMIQALIFARHLESIPRIKEMQVVQEKVGTIIVNIVKMPQYTDADEQEIVYKIQQAAINRLDVKVAYVDEIPRTKNGKYRFLVQKLPIDFGNYKNEYE